METSALKRKIIFSVCLSGMLIFSVFGCHTKNSKNVEPNLVETDNVEFFTPNDLKNDFPSKAVDKLKNVVITTITATESEQNKAELNEIVQYLESIPKDANAYFESSKNFIEFLNKAVRVSLVLANNNPDNFDVSLNLSSQYLHFARTLEQIERYDPSENGRRLSREYKNNGIQSAKDLVEKFPNNAKAYGHLAHSLYYIAGGDIKKSADLYKHCLELDEEMKFCQEGYNALSKK